MSDFFFKKKYATCYLILFNKCYIYYSAHFYFMWFLYLQSNTALSLQQENRLKQMGATVRNANSYIKKLKLNEERQRVARNVMGKMSVEQLSDLMSFYHMMGQICSEVLERKLNGVVNGFGSWPINWSPSFAVKTSVYVYITHDDPLLTHVNLGWWFCLDSWSAFLFVFISVYHPKSCNFP